MFIFEKRNWKQKIVYIIHVRPYIQEKFVLKNFFVT